MVSNETGTRNSLLNKDFRSLTLPSNITQVEGDRCEYGLRECGENEECVPLGDRRKDGFCQCLRGFYRKEVTRECVLWESTTSANFEESEFTTITSGDDGKTTSHINSLSSPDSSFPLPVTSTSVVLPEEFITTPVSNVSSPKPVGKLVVSINNKTVYLPPDSTFYEDRVTLSAYAIGGMYIF